MVGAWLSPPPPPGGGTVEVTSPLTSAMIASRTSRDGHFAVIPLSAGTYTVIGTFADAIINGQYAKRSMSVQIPAGHTVRQDFILSIP